MDVSGRSRSPLRSAVIGRRVDSPSSSVFDIFYLHGDMRHGFDQTMHEILTKVKVTIVKLSKNVASLLPYSNLKDLRMLCTSNTRIIAPPHHKSGLFFSNNLKFESK